MKAIALFLCLMAHFFCLPARHALESLQDIHKQVGSSLLTIRKNYPESQQQVYTTIDQVSKLCDISKKQYFKRKSLKESLATEKKKSDHMMEKVERVAQKIIELQKEVAEKDEKILSLLHQDIPEKTVSTPIITPAPVQYVTAGEELPTPKQNEVKSEVPKAE
jgi:hypothetical protein